MIELAVLIAGGVAVWYFWPQIKAYVANLTKPSA